jgi:hypothetical protein
MVWLGNVWAKAIDVASKEKKTRVGWLIAFVQYRLIVSDLWGYVF